MRLTVAELSGVGATGSSGWTRGDEDISDGHRRWQQQFGLLRAGGEVT